MLRISTANWFPEARPSPHNRETFLSLNSQGGRRQLKHIPTLYNSVYILQNVHILYGTDHGMLTYFFYSVYRSFSYTYMKYVLRTLTDRQ
jgi:hypothetical protein